MPIDPNSVGATTEPAERSWDSTDCLLYAVSVGSGVDEIEFTTENSIGVTQKVLPTFPVILGARGDLTGLIGEFDRANLVHGGQAVVLHRPLPAEGTIRTVGRVVSIYDKGQAAVVELETEAVDAASGDALFESRSQLFIRGEGGWGGDRGPSGSANDPPDRAPDHVVTYETARDQALLYRLNGDRNPLHSDPEFARKAGFDRPILHGLCTYGFTGRALVHSLLGGEVERFGSMEGRFSKPVYPGDSLTISIWADGTEAWFRTANQQGETVIDRGRCTIT